MTARGYVNCTIRTAERPRCADLDGDVVALQAILAAVLCCSLLLVPGLSKPSSQRRVSFR